MTNLRALFFYIHQKKINDVLFREIPALLGKKNNFIVHKDENA